MTFSREEIKQLGGPFALAAAFLAGGIALVYAASDSLAGARRQGGIDVGGGFPAAAVAATGSAYRLGRCVGVRVDPPSDGISGENQMAQ